MILYKNDLKKFVRHFENATDKTWRSWERTKIELDPTKKAATANVTPRNSSYKRIINSLGRGSTFPESEAGRIFFYVET